MKKTRYIKKDAVIAILKEDGQIYTELNSVKGARGQLVYQSRTWEVCDKNGTCYGVSHMTIESLKRNGIIMSGKPYSYIPSEESVSLNTPVTKAELNELT